MTRSESGRLGSRAAFKAGTAMQIVRHTQAVVAHGRADKRCRTCNQPIVYKKRGNTFCTRSCAARLNNGRRSSPSEMRHCPCGKRLARGSRAYCSYRCQRAGEWAGMKQRLLAVGCVEQPRTAKRLLADTRGYRCEVCGLCNWQGAPLMLTLDHEDGNPYNNSIANLRLLCPNCHSQTGSFAGRNRGYGRVARRERDRMDYKRRLQVGVPQWQRDQLEVLNSAGSTPAADTTRP